ncbi:MAG TPA: hypothetical protein DDW92_02170 [Candidatus Veblenbacteria bacterium]|uniref:Uncharacterized protein n=5 Tax=Candidatus Vebleniibacteriota TaxID=1817921 RepID=A0A1G2Q648_9BACT|nr:MAG: hypothetical protein UV47_C0012G0021 [Parcubacteria group bacterium GW2011_GWA2_42_80]KKS79407.1 MAG: hypothetical protein UV52_C0010G0007 [Parcubacteria group bacterium GW2011_GWD1_42_9]KKS94122.1 MAG: hypothetical protein UV69_C0001G0011 [Parcubacteria group bacterium GW2011_GWE2_43_12]KKT14033.1 MAG: hypothetical protein UV92_C0008G0024 [Parcubacteria group bacterium GW2011_GWA1_43_27]KKT15992.1 MAG: hypothetical protein UV96_C0007G0008 [Parcubacteria group bacterium GW2011_GWF2_43_3
MNKFAILLTALLLIAASAWAQTSLILGTPDTRIDQKKYLSAVKTFMQSDSSFAVVDSIICVMSGYGPGNPLTQIRGLQSSLQKNSYTIYMNSTPADMIQDWRWANSNIDPRIQPHRGLTKVSRYCLVIKQDSLQSILWLQDYLAVNPWRWSHLINGDSITIIQSLLTELKRKDIAQVNMADIKPETYDYMISLVGEPIDSASQALLRALATDGWTMKISYGNYGGMAIENIYYLKPDKLASLGKINIARLNGVVFIKSVDSLENILRQYAEFDTFDTFGNNVCRDMVADALTSSTRITYFPALALMDSVVAIEYSFDLKYLGYSGVLNKIFSSPSVSRIKIDDPWPYMVYGVKKILPKLESYQVKDFLLGIADIESLFAYDLSEVIKRIYITTDHIQNAGYNSSDTASVYVHELTLSKIDTVGFLPVDARIVGRHEAIHAIADKLGLNDNELLGQLFWELHSEFRANIMGGSGYFYAQLDEEKFDPDSAIFGGHSFESPKEFLASYLNSVVHENWEEIMAKKSEGFSQTYTHVTQVMRNIFIGRPELKNTAMASLLEVRLVWFKENK